MTTIHLIGRIVLGLYFTNEGLKHFLMAKGYIGYAGMKKVPMPSLAVYGSGLVAIAAGLGILLNFYTQIALGLVVIFLVPVSFFMHDFWKETDPQKKSNEKIAFMKNIALAAAALMMF